MTDQLKTKKYDPFLISEGSTHTEKTLFNAEVFDKERKHYICCLSLKMNSAKTKNIYKKFMQKKNEIFCEMLRHICSSFKLRKRRREKFRSRLDILRVIRDCTLWVRGVQSVAIGPFAALRMILCL